MPNQLLLRISTAFLLFASAAWTSTANAATACVWRITNVPAPFYLCGTFHALSGTDYPLPKAYDQALRDSTKLLFEIDLHPSGTFNQKFVRAAAYPTGDSIRRHVHPKTIEYLEKNFRISNMTGHRNWRWGDFLFDDIEQLRPWAIAYYVWAIHGYNDVFSKYGVDRHLSYQALRLGKQVGGLETDEEHIEVLRGMADIDSELVLLDAMVQGDKRRDTYKKMCAAWKVGNLEPLIVEGDRQRKLNLGAEIRLLDYRNLRWVKRIEAEIAGRQPTAIVVGAGHLVGPNSVVDLLQKRGYKVEQL